MMEGSLLEEFGDVVDRIYAAALEPAAWPAAVEGIARLHRAPKANFLTPASPPAQGGFIFPYGLDAAALETWDARYREDDVWFQATSRRGLLNPGRVLLNADMMTQEEFESSRHYREFLRFIDIAEICTAVIFDDSSPPALPTVLSVFRGHHDAPFDDRSRRLHDLLSRHVSRALGVMFRLRLADLRIASNIAALNRLPISVLLLDDAGDVTFANDRALETLRRMDGLELHSSELQRGALGRLKASNPADDGRLQREIAAAVSIHTVDVRHFTEGVVLHRPNGRAPLLLQLSALSLDNEYSRRERHAAAIGFLVDPASQLHLDPQLLKDAFGLTRAECALAQEMLTGDSLKRIASTLSLSTNTIKSQLDAIFAKTGVHRQAHLVKLLVAFAKPGQH